MTKIKYDVNTMKFISLFESITGAALKDCFEQNSRLIFVVKQGEIGKAIGKRGLNIKKLERVLRKKIKIIEFNPELLQFVQNIVFPSKVKEIKQEDSTVIITPPDSETRGYLIGKSAVNLRNTEEIVKRYFDITEIKVI
ncbi:NusA-like transcription termination signal-binding factor [Candidatus Woesearchaeota archaeon]|nr:NusA-like transcription termination signal-binding factor [Candidatus Woesearchaeota archaeon]